MAMMPANQYQFAVRGGSSTRLASPALGSANYLDRSLLPNGHFFNNRFSLDFSPNPMSAS
jgi:hypothetical protein